ncbi:MAG: hypothetical protein Kow0067_06500 [Coriobacteriia bacterium]|jgi:Uncharacterized component of anaerobic dehydrogenases
MQREDDRIIAVEGGCVCALGDRSSAYEILARFFGGSAHGLGATVAPLLHATRTCQTQPYIDQAAIDVTAVAAADALEDEAGEKAFENTRRSLIGGVDGFDPFLHAVPANECVFVGGDICTAQVRAHYQAAGYAAPDTLNACAGDDHIAIELDFMRFLLERVETGRTDAAGCASRFFADHLSAWAVLFAVVVSRGAEHPGLRLAGLVLDKFIACEAVTFRHAVPAHCALRGPAE